MEHVFIIVVIVSIINLIDSKRFSNATSLTISVVCYFGIKACMTAFVWAACLVTVVASALYLTKR